MCYIRLPGVPVIELISHNPQCHKSTAARASTAAVMQISDGRIGWVAIWDGVERSERAEFRTQVSQSMRLFLNVEYASLLR